MCHYHGARAGRPPVNGRYTKLADLAGRIERSLTDPNQLDLRAEVGIMGVLLDDLAGKMFSGEPSADPAKALKLAKAAQAAVTYGEQDRAGRAVQELVDLLEGDVEQRHIRDEFRLTVANLKSLITTQVNQDLLRAGMIPAHVVVEYINWNIETMIQFLTVAERTMYMTKLRQLIGPNAQGVLIDGEFQPVED